MPVSITTIDRDFMAGEAEAVTGVSTALQRDWRRRGLLPETEPGTWARFNLTDIIEMLVMKIGADAGLYVADAKLFASTAILPALREIYDIDGAIEFVGDPIDRDDRDKILSSAITGGEGRFLLVTKDGKTNDQRVSRCDRLSHIGDFLEDNAAAHCFVIDCRRVAKTIADRAGTALVRIDVKRQQEAAV